MRGSRVRFSFPAPLPSIGYTTLMTSYPPLQAPKRLLFGPGPSMVAPRVYAAMGQGVVGHLDPFFFEVTEQIRSLLGYAYSTQNQFCLAVSGTGSAGMEAAVANFAEPGRNSRCSPTVSLPTASAKWRAARAPKWSSYRRNGASPRSAGSPRLYPPRAAPDGGLRAGRDIDRHVQPGQTDLRSGARSRRADDRRLRHLARRNAGAGG